jgi:pSer/pThr/pTyr-binding forkhead associated (FHA) protein
LIEYDDEQRCFILKDLNSSTGTYVHECRVQNAAVRLADRDFIRFGFHGLPLEFRVEQQQQEVILFLSISLYKKIFSDNNAINISKTIEFKFSSCYYTNNPITKNSKPPATTN